MLECTADPLSFSRKALTSICRTAVGLFSLDYSCLILFREVVDQRQTVAEYPNLGIYDLKVPLCSNSVEQDLLVNKSPLVFEDALEEPLLEPVRDILLRFNVQSLLFVPITVVGQVVGTFVQASVDHLRSFSEEEVRHCQLLADHIAVTIAERIELAERVRRFQVIISTLAQMHSSDSLEDALRSTAHGVRQLLNCDQVNLTVWDPNYSDVQLLSVTEGTKHFKSVLRQRHLSQDSVVYRLLEQDKLYVSEDAQHDPVMSSPFVMREGIVATVGVPLQATGQKIGVMFINYLMSHHFAESELDDIQFVADQAAAVISCTHRVATQIDRLQKINQILAARAALASIGMVGNIWRHETQKHATTITYEIDALYTLIPAQAITGECLQKLEKIKRLAQAIIEQPIILPLSKEERMESVLVNDLLRERTRQLQERGVGEAVRYELKLDLSDSACAQVSPEWLRRAIDIIIDNAIQAIGQSANGVIIVSTKENSGWAEIRFLDNGVGIPAEDIPRLFKQPIPRHTGDRGLGAELIIARHVAEAYGGTIEVETTGPEGNVILIRLPLEA